MMDKKTGGSEEENLVSFGKWDFLGFLSRTALMDSVTSTS